MAQNSHILLISRGEYEHDRTTLKNDLKELINQERADRKEGENNLNAAIERVETQIQEINSKITWGVTSLLIAIIILVLEVLFGKV